MPRPLLDERISVRVPSVLLALLLRAASRRNCSVNDVVVNAVENDFARIAGFASDFYLDIVPLLTRSQADIVPQWRTQEGA